MEYGYTLLEQVVEFLWYLSGIYFFTSIPLCKKKCVYVGIFVVAVLLVLAEECWKLDYYDPLLWVLFQLLAVALVIKGRVMQRFAYSFLTMAVISFVYGMISTILEVVWENSIEQKVYAIVFTLFLIWILGVILRFWDKQRYIKKIHISVTLCVIIALGVLLMTSLMVWGILYYKKSRNINWNVTKILIVISIIGIGFLLLLLFFVEGILKQQKEKMQFMERYEEMQKLHYQELLQNNKKLKMFRHDVNHHFGYEVIDIILSQFAGQIEEKKIIFQFTHHLYNDLKIEDVDMSALLYNLLQNAIEACDKIEDGERKIFFSIKEHNQNIFIRVENTVSQEFDKRSIRREVTTKENNEMHGFGIGNIKRIAKRYHGELEYEFYEGKVSAHVVLFGVTEE